MPEIVMEDDLLPSEVKLKLEYKGKNPFLAYQKIKGIVTGVLHIASSTYWERDFRWDSSSDPRSFYVRIYAKRSLDNRSHILIEILMQGKQPSDSEKEGQVYIQLRGKLVTKYSFSTAIQNMQLYKSFVMIYNWLFYWRIRRRYLQMGKTFLFEIYDKLKDLWK